jgi:ribosomal protein S18 acetylase RimI-like enzyme
MALTFTELASDAHDVIVPLLRLAEPEEGALRWGLAHLSDAAYRVDDDTGALVGAVSVRWRGADAEIEELAVEPTRQCEGIGRAIVEWVIDEARRRGKRAVVVGTANSSIGNIAFYQKCRFRMDRVRKDYFAYYEDYYGSVREEDGIVVRDMLVFRRPV